MLYVIIKCNNVPVFTWMISRRIFSIYIVCGHCFLFSWHKLFFKKDAAHILYRSYNVKEPRNGHNPIHTFARFLGFFVVEVRLLPLWSSASSSILLSCWKISAGWIFEGMTGSSFVRHGRTVMDDDRSIAQQWCISLDFLENDGRRRALFLSSDQERAVMLVL